MITNYKKESRLTFEIEGSTKVDALRKAFDINKNDNVDVLVVYDLVDKDYVVFKKDHFDYLNNKKEIEAKEWKVIQEFEAQNDTSKDVNINKTKGGEEMGISNGHLNSSGSSMSGSEDLTGEELPEEELINNEEMPEEELINNEEMPEEEIVGGEDNINKASLEVPGEEQPEEEMINNEENPEEEELINNKKKKANEKSSILSTIKKNESYKRENKDEIVYINTSENLNEMSEQEVILNIIPKGIINHAKEGDKVEIQDAYRLKPIIFIMKNGKFKRIVPEENINENKWGNPAEEIERLEKMKEDVKNHKRVYSLAKIDKKIKYWQNILEYEKNKNESDNRKTSLSQKQIANRIYWYNSMRGQNKGKFTDEYIDKRIEELQKMQIKESKQYKKESEISMEELFKEQLKLCNGDERKAAEFTLSLATMGLFDASEGQARETAITKFIEKYGSKKGTKQEPKEELPKTELPEETPKVESRQIKEGNIKYNKIVGKYVLGFIDGKESLNFKQKEDLDVILDKYLPNHREEEVELKDIVNLSTEDVTDLYGELEMLYGSNIKESRTIKEDKNDLDNLYYYVSDIDSITENERVIVIKFSDAIVDINKRTNRAKIRSSKKPRDSRYPLRGYDNVVTDFVGYYNSILNEKDKANIIKELKEKKEWVDKLQSLESKANRILKIIDFKRTKEEKKELEEILKEIDDMKENLYDYELVDYNYAFDIDEEDIDNQIVNQAIQDEKDWDELNNPKKFGF